MDLFKYLDYPFGRYVFRYQEWGAVIMVTDGNRVVAGRFSKNEMPKRVKYAFRPKKWTLPKQCI